MDKKRIYIVVNKAVPYSDYRIQSALSIHEYHVQLCMPEKTAGLPDDRFIPLSFRDGVRWQDVLMFGKLFRLLWRTRKQTHCVHFFSTKLILAGPFIAWVAGVPSLITVTGFGRIFQSRGVGYAFLRWVYRRFFHLSMRLSRYVLFQNHTDLNRIKNTYPHYHEKCQYIGSAIEMKPIHEKSFEEIPLQILLVSRLLQTKGIDDFLQVAERLQDKRLQFTLVGPADKSEPDLYERVLHYDQQKRIDYKGELTGETLNQVYTNCSVFFFPSLGEGLPRVLLEAGFSLLCPLVYNIPGNVDLVRAGRGFVFNTGDIEAVMETIQFLDQNRNVVRTNAIAFQQYVIEQFSMDRYMERLTSFLQDIDV